MSSSATTTITISDTDLSGMTAWEDRWFRVKIRSTQEEGSTTTGYLKIRAWNSAQRILQSSLYTQNSETRDWESVDLPLHYTSGQPLRFLCWFDYVEEYAFGASIQGFADNGVLRSATFKAVGIYHSPADGGSHSENDDSDDDGQINGMITISGKMVSQSSVPRSVLGQ